MLLWSCLLALCLLLAETPLHAATIELPLFLRTQILQNALQESLTPGPDRKASLYQKDRYNFFHIADPLLTLRNGEPHFRCNIAAGVGFESLGVLPSAVQWNGFIEMELMLYVDDQWRLRYRIKNSAIYDENGVQAVLTSFVWNLSRRFLYPILENFSLDLSLPRQEILELLRNSVAPEDLATLEATLNTIAMGKLRADSNGIVVPLLLTVAAEEAPHSLPAQQPLTLAEIEGLQHLFEPLDAFLVFVVKSAGADFSDPQLRSQLFDLLITNRYRLLAILAGESSVDSTDPLRKLFIEVWQQLRAIIESSSGQAVQSQEQLLRYMTFVNAGDALLALDTAAPQLGMHITTDGLRRLARMLQPGYKEDPLHFDWEIDPALRNLLNFLTEPVPSPATPTLGALLLGILVGTAHAEETVPLTLAEVSNRLNGWVPTGPELEEYGFLLAQLLRNAGQAQIQNEGLTPDIALIYQHLVPATAMIESCWRQFVRNGDQVTCIRSKSGSLGIMQINQHVWRGFYSIERLKSDVFYNIQAGTQILMRYFKEYGLKVAGTSGQPAHAARAAYAAYNAGPQASRRFLKQSASAREKRVDNRLWKLYQGFAGGGSANLDNCSVDANGS
ncbi:MAG: transglycosylase SLT domain-containing protein [Desulfobulbaceae bacterium]